MIKEQSKALTDNQANKFAQAAVEKIFRDMDQNKLIHYLTMFIVEKDLKNEDGKSIQSTITRGARAMELAFAPLLQCMPEYAKNLLANITKCCELDASHYLFALCKMLNKDERRDIPLDESVYFRSGGSLLLSYLIPLAYLKVYVLPYRYIISDTIRCYHEQIDQNLQSNNQYYCARYNVIDDYLPRNFKVITPMRPAEMQGYGYTGVSVQLGYLNDFMKLIDNLIIKEIKDIGYMLNDPFLLIIAASNVKICVATCLHVLRAREQQELVQQERSENEALLGDNMIGVASTIGVDKVDEGGVADLSIALPTADSEAQEKSSLRIRMIDLDAGDGSENELLSLNTIMRNFAGNVFAFGKFMQKCAKNMAMRGVSIVDASAVQNPEAMILAQQEMRKIFQTKDNSLCSKRDMVLYHILPYIGALWFLQDSVSGRLLRGMHNIRIV